MMQEAYWDLFHNGLAYYPVFGICLVPMLDARPTATTPLDYVNRDRPNLHLDTGLAPSSIQINLAPGFPKLCFRPR